MPSEALQLYVENCRKAVFGPEREAAFDQLMRAADLWRGAGRHFSAAIAAGDAVDAAWGRPDLMLIAQRSAIADLGTSYQKSPPSSPEGLAALQTLQRDLGRTLWLFETNRQAVNGMIRSLSEELGQRLVENFANSEHAESYLVRGVRISTDLEGEWSIEFPVWEVDPSFGIGGSPRMIAIPSAFKLFVQQEDWYGAHGIILRHPTAFTTPGLNGQRNVVLAAMNPGRAVELLDAAADAFALDTEPSTNELVARGGWSGINVQLWAKYYRARARIAEALQEPKDVARLIGEAARSMEGMESGWHAPTPARFRILVQSLAKLISDPTVFEP